MDQLLSNDNAIVFPSLKTLIADNMANLKSAEIKGSHLQNISLNKV